MEVQVLSRAPVRKKLTNLLTNQFEEKGLFKGHLAPRRRTFGFLRGKQRLKHGRLAQWLERPAHYLGQLAQRLERIAYIDEVASSNLALPTLNGLEGCRFESYTVHFS